MEEKLDKIIALLEQINENTKTYNGYVKWTYEQEELLDIMYNQGYSITEIIEAIREKFGIDRSSGAITSRLSKLGIQHNKKKPLKKPPQVLEVSPGSIYEDTPF